MLKKDTLLTEKSSGRETVVGGGGAGQCEHSENNHRHEMGSATKERGWCSLLHETLLCFTFLLRMFYFLKSENKGFSVQL